jgi:hypothetical protein
MESLGPVCNFPFLVDVDLPCILRPLAFETIAHLSSPCSRFAPLASTSLGYAPVMREFRDIPWGTSRAPAHALRATHVVVSSKMQESIAARSIGWKRRQVEAKREKGNNDCILATAGTGLSGGRGRLVLGGLFHGFAVFLTEGSHTFRSYVDCLFVVGPGLRVRPDQRVVPADLLEPFLIL